MALGILFLFLVAREIGHGPAGTSEKGEGEGVEIVPKTHAA
jgi:hypothetical protein